MHKFVEYYMVVFFTLHTWLVQVQLRLLLLLLLLHPVRRRGRRGGGGRQVEGHAADLQGGVPGVGVHVRRRDGVPEVDGGGAGGLAQLNVLVVQAVVVAVDALLLGRGDGVGGAGGRGGGRGGVERAQVVDGGARGGLAPERKRPKEARPFPGTNRNKKGSLPGLGTFFFEGRKK